MHIIFFHELFDWLKSLKIKSVKKEKKPLKLEKMAHVGSEDCLGE